MIYISVKNKKILDNIIEIFDNNELKFCYDNDDMYSLIRKSTIVVTDSNPTVIKFALKEKKQIIILLCYVNKMIHLFVSQHFKKEF